MLAADRFQKLGDYAQARPLYERILAIRERACGPDHPNTAMSLNNLAGLFKPRVISPALDHSLRAPWRSKESRAAPTIPIRR